MTSWSLVLQQPEISFRKSAITGDNKNNNNNLITTHNYLTLYPLVQTIHAGENKHYSRHRKHNVKLCTIGSKTLCSPLVGGKTTNHNKKRFDPTNEYIFSKNTSGAEC